MCISSEATTVGITPTVPGQDKGEQKTSHSLLCKGAFLAGAGLTKCSEQLISPL